jgi:hypothetical protein
MAAGADGLTSVGPGHGTEFLHTCSIAAMEWFMIDAYGIGVASVHRQERLAIGVRAR